MENLFVGPLDESIVYFMLINLALGYCRNP